MTMHLCNLLVPRHRIHNNQSLPDPSAPMRHQSRIFLSIVAPLLSSICCVVIATSTPANLRNHCDPLPCFPSNSASILNRPSSIFPTLQTMEEEGSASVHAKEVTRLWRSWRTIHEMVQDRVRNAETTDSFSLSETGILTLFCCRVTNWLKMRSRSPSTASAWSTQMTTAAPSTPPLFPSTALLFLQ